LQAGFTEVANLAGGMLRWRAGGHKVDGGSG
jgi:rhodanese-related sulfurtransferase